MRLSPIIIKQQEFAKAFRGYQTEEVDSFLEKVADDFGDLQKENEDLKRELQIANEQLAEFRKIEKNLQDTLLKAQESSSKAVESTRKQTALMIKEAEIKAQQIIDKAKESANEIRSSIIHLREERDLIIAKLKAIVVSQSNLLELKVERAGEEPQPEKKIETPKKMQINIDQVIDKLL